MVLDRRGVNLEPTNIANGLHCLDVLLDFNEVLDPLVELSKWRVSGGHAVEDLLLHGFEVLTSNSDFNFLEVLLLNSFIESFLELLGNISSRIKEFLEL